MADNTTLNSGTGGDVIASDDIGGVKHQRVKISVGADGAASDAIPVSNGLDTTAAGVPAVGLVAQFDDAATGTVTENQFAPVRISSRRALLVEGVASGTVIPVSDGGGALTVDGTVAVTNADLGTIAGAVSGTEMQVDVLTMPTVTVTANNLDVQSGGADLATSAQGSGIQTAVELIDDAVYVDDADWTDNTSKHLLVGGLYQATPQTVTDGDVAPFNITTNGALHVAVQNTVTVASHAVTNAGTFAVQVDGAALTSLQLADDVVAVLGTDTYTETTSKGTVIAAVRRDADTTLVNTTNEFGPLQMDANGRLKVEAFSGETLPVSVSGVSTVAEQQTQTTALQLIDDIVYTDDTSTHETGTSKGALMMAAATPTDAAVNANDIGAVAMTVNRELHVSLTTALPAGTAAIGKLAANSGVDIGDVDVTSVGTITPGTAATSLGKAEDAGHSTGDVGVAVLGVRTDTPNVARADTDLDYSVMAVNRLGSVRVAALEDDLATAATKHTYKYYTNAGAVTDGIIWSPAAGARWFLSSLTINVSAAATVTIEDDVAAGDVVRFKFEFAANSGIHMDFPIPMFSGEDAADLLVTTTAGNVYITAIGYEI